MAVRKSSTQPVGRKKSTREHFLALKAPFYTLFFVFVAVAAFGFSYVAYYDTVVEKIMFGIGPIELIFTGIAMIALYKVYQRM